MSLCVHRNTDLILFQRCLSKRIFASVCLCSVNAIVNYLMWQEVGSALGARRKDLS